MDSPVIIVGRGPVGMVTALLLAKWEVPSIIVERLPIDQVIPGSKAVLISGHVIGMTEPIGVGAHIEAEGLAWTTSRTFIRGKEVLSQDVSLAPGMIPKVTNLTQQRVEELLLEKVLENPLITVVSEATVTDVENVSDGVIVHIDTPEASKELKAQWLVGADGSRSTVRKKLGIPFSGYGHDENFLIVDISADLPFPNERHFHFDAEFNPGKTTLIHPQPDSTWHIDFQVGEELDADEEKASGRLDKRIKAVIGERPYELHWLTTYKFKQLRAASFRKDRSFLVGDAAHLTSPYGARGMNSGISDAEDLAWRLAMVLKHGASEDLLNGYAPERESASDENLRITGKTAKFMCPQTPSQKFVRRLILEAVRAVPPARGVIDSGSFYEPATYGSEESIVGSIAPDGLIMVAGEPTSRLSELLRQGIAIVVFPQADPLADSETITEILEEFPLSYPIQVVEIVRGVPAPTTDFRHVRVHDVDGTLAEKWQVSHQSSDAFVVRPDAYIAAHVPLNKVRVTETLKSIFSLNLVQEGFH